MSEKKRGTCQYEDPKRAQVLEGSGSWAAPFAVAGRGRTPGLRASWMRSQWDADGRASKRESDGARNPTGLTGSGQASTEAAVHRSEAAGVFGREGGDGRERRQRGDPDSPDPLLSVNVTKLADDLQVQLHVTCHGAGR